MASTISLSRPPVTTGKIIVTKQVVNDGGGTKRPSDFTINVDGNNPSPQSFPGALQAHQLN